MALPSLLPLQLRGRKSALRKISPGGLARARRNTLQTFSMFFEAIGVDLSFVSVEGFKDVCGLSLKNQDSTDLSRFDKFVASRDCGAA